MDRRKIKKIPLSPVPETPEGYFFNVTSRVVNMGSRILLMDVHYDDGGYMRIAFDKKNKDWGDYSSDNPKWRKRYTGEYYYAYRAKRYTWEQRRLTGATFISEADKKRISRYFNGRLEWDDEIFNFQQEIRGSEARERAKKKTLLTEERHRLLPALPENFIKWAKAKMNMEYIYYKRNRKYMECTCSACGNTYTINTKGVYRKIDRELPYKERFVRGDKVKCVKCGTLCTAKPESTCKYGYTLTQYFNIGQKYGEKGFVFRQIELSKNFYTDRKNDFCLSERTRLYSDGYWEYRHIGFSEEYWNQKPPQMYYNVWMTRDCPTYPETFENIKGTEWQYSQLEKVDEMLGELNGLGRTKMTLWDYLDVYREDKWLEAMIKLNLGWIVYDRCAYYSTCRSYEIAAKTPYEYLRVYKHRIKDLQAVSEFGFPKLESGNKLLKAFRAECELKADFTLEQCRYIATATIDVTQLRTLLTYTSLEKAANYVRKQLCHYGTTANTMSHYVDYLSLRDQMGYDMTDSIILFPRNLETAHDNLIEQSQKAETDKRKREKEKTFKRIRDRFKKALKAYEYENEGLIIRPAKSASEIIDEGRKLHHCVGGDNYLSRHSKGTSTILLLRSTEHIRTPYVTVEITPDRKIAQWYGAYDKKPDKEHLDKWLKDYVGQLKPKAVKEAV